jgi:hypothetical protein
MALRITVEAAAAGWQASVAPASPPDAAPPQFGPLAPRRLQAGAQGYPHPPAAEEPDWAADAAALCKDPSDADLAKLHRNIVIGDPDYAKRDVVRFGTYLTEVLLGPWWKAITSAMPVGPIELELEFSPDDEKLNRLPWEMMMAPGGTPLTAFSDPNRRIAITRVLQCNDLPAEHAIELPLRVLFVVGAQLDDALRPGTEYLALLRDFNMGPQAAPSAALHAKLLLEATSTSLMKAIDAVHPSIVHIVAHGTHGDQGPVILLTPEDRDRLSSGDPVTAQRLAGILRGQEPGTPRVQAVVLNACHTGQPNESYLSYAAELVQLGVPVVAGMSGEVADGACRIFTRAFYRGLVRSENLDAACADGRRAAVLKYDKIYTKSIEWSRPTLFRAKDVRPSLQTNQVLTTHALAAMSFRERGPDEALCGRLNAIQIFQRLCATSRVGGAVALALEVALDAAARAPVNVEVVRYGKTWLLRELAAQASLEGFVPSLLAKSSVEVPGNVLLFALRLADVMNETRKRFGKQARPGSQAQRLAFGIVAPDANVDLTDQIQVDFELALIKNRLRGSPPHGGEWVDVNTVIGAIRADLAQLLTDVGAAEGAGAMVLIDDLDRYEGVAIPLLQALDDYGLGQPGMPVPLVFTHNIGKESGPNIKDELNGRQAKILREQLRAFAPPQENMLAYRQYLLSKRFAPACVSESRDRLNKWYAFCHERIQGLPSALYKFDDWAPQLEIVGTLLTANDEEIINERRKADGL